MLHEPLSHYYQLVLVAYWSQVPLALHCWSQPGRRTALLVAGRLHMGKMDSFSSKDMVPSSLVVEDVVVVVVAAMMALLLACCVVKT